MQLDCNCNWILVHYNNNKLELHSVFAIQRTQDTPFEIWIKVRDSVSQSVQVYLLCSTLLFQVFTISRWIKVNLLHAI